MEALIHLKISNQHKFRVYGNSKNNYETKIRILNIRNISVYMAIYWQLNEAKKLKIKNSKEIF